MGVLIKLGTWLFRGLGFIALFGGLWGIDHYIGFTDKLAGLINGLFAFQNVLYSLASDASTVIDNYFAHLLSDNTSSAFQFIAYVCSLDVAMEYLSTACDFIFYAIFCGVGGGLISVAEVALGWYIIVIARKIIKSVAAGVYQRGAEM